MPLSLFLFTGLVCMDLHEIRVLWWCLHKSRMMALPPMLAPNFTSPLPWAVFRPQPSFPMSFWPASFGSSKALPAAGHSLPGCPSSLSPRLHFPGSSCPGGPWFAHVLGRRKRQKTNSHPPPLPKSHRPSSQWGTLPALLRAVGVGLPLLRKAGLASHLW